MTFLRLIKEKLKNIGRHIIGKLSLNKNYLSVTLLESSQIRCRWYINNRDSKMISNNNTFLLCIRMYDITNIKNKEIGTCIMKEVEANKLSKECVLTPPVSTGTLRIEIGYREPFGEWFLLSSSLLCLAERTNEAFLPNDLWFYLSSNPEKESESIHERIYQLSNNLINGGSDVAHEKSKHIKG